jgi:hypothetical protein
VDGGSFATCTSPRTTSTLSDGAHTFQVRAVDNAGRIDPTPAAWSFTIDTVPPPTPTLTGTDPVSPANENHPKIKGTAATGSSVVIYATSSCTGSPTATGSAADLSTGISVSVPDNSTTELNATASDAAGNVSGCSASSVTYVEETPPPPDPPPAPGGDPPPGPAGPGGADPDSPITVDVTGPSMAITGKALKLKANGSLALSLSCPASEPGGCMGSLAIEAAVQVKADKRKIKLGKGSFRIAGGRSGAVKLRLSRKNRALVRKLRKVRVLVVVYARDQVGNSTTSRKNLVLKAG